MKIGLFTFVIANQKTQISMKDRIYQLMQKEGLTNAEFAEKIGVSTSSLSHIFSGRNKPSLEVVMRIQKAYPSIRLNWLLYGEGEMEEPPQMAGLRFLTEDRPEKGEIAAEESGDANFRTDNRVLPPDFSTKETANERVRYIERPLPKITEIRIFFDNGTYEVFKPDR